MSLSIDDLFSVETFAAAKASLLSYASALGLPVTSWQEGQATRTIYESVAQKFADLSSVMALLNMSGFLDWATGGWLTVLAAQVYNVSRIVAQAGTTTLTVTKSTAGNLGPFAPGALHFADSVTQKTYTNTTTVTIIGSAATPVPIISDGTGSSWLAAAGEISIQVTPLIGCTTTNAVALTATDDETDPNLRIRCRAKLGSLSPNGPKDAYNFVAKSTLRADGTNVDITRSRTTGDSTTGNVIVTLAALNGAPTAPDVSLCDAQIQSMAVPLCISETTQGATNNVIAITYTAWCYATANQTTAQLSAAILAKLTAFFQGLPIGGATKTPGTPNTGVVFLDVIKGVIESASPFIFAVSIGTPSSDVVMTDALVATLGTVTPTITLVVPT